MAQEIKKTKKYESVRIRPNHKERIETVVATLSLRKNKTTEINIMTEILDKELPKLERKYGIN